jgi:hydrogenase maturation protein HypF
MRHFPMCIACRSEYDDPVDRRFHAEAIACPACGPQLALWDRDGTTLALRDDALRRAADMIRAGAIVAVKATGGFQLMVDARNDDAVRRLRARKHRPDKPFAVMFPDLAAIEAEAVVNPVERAHLESAALPIVLLKACPGRCSPAVAPAPASAPGLLGAMLPSTPLHYLLLGELGFPVVATSGNLSGEPLATDEREAAHRLRGVADALLVHDRPVLRPVDDSVVRVVAGRAITIRRARGCAPLPVPADAPAGILALGAHMKAAVAISTSSGDAILSQHIGDLDSAETGHAFGRAVADLEQLCATPVRRVAHDLHPDYASTRHAVSLGLPAVPVQHHAAHVAAVIAEHRLALPVLGVAWDGTGLGTDGTIWGGEFIRVDETGWTRVAHLAPMRLPGGDAAAREPRRAAVAALAATFGAWAEMTDLAPVAAFTAAERRTLGIMLARGVQAPRATSAGRLFDAVAALLGLVQKATYEGQAAAMLELTADGNPLPYHLDIVAKDGGPLELDWRPVIAAIVADIRRGVPASAIAYAFHAGLAQAIAETAARLGDMTVALAGGCFQNKRLTEQTIAALTAAGRSVFWPEAIPANDGGIALGQVWWAARSMGGA